MKKLKEEVEEKGLKLSVTENGKEGKSKMIASWRSRSRTSRPFWQVKLELLASTYCVAGCTE